MYIGNVGSWMMTATRHSRIGKGSTEVRAYDLIADGGFLLRYARGCERVGWCIFFEAAAAGFGDTCPMASGAYQI